MRWSKQRVKRNVTHAALRKLCRRLVVELRDRNTCQRCGSTGYKIDWAHVKAGRAETLQYQEWASLALCAGCHFYYDGRGNGRPGSESRIWWAEKWPDRDLKLTAWEHQRNRPKFDPVTTKMYLEQEIARLENKACRVGQT